MSAVDVSLEDFVTVTCRNGTSFMICKCGHWLGRQADSCPCCNGKLNEGLINLKARAEAKGENVDISLRPRHGNVPHLAVMLP